MLADVTAMHRSALPAIDWEAQADSHLSALLGRGTFVSEGPCETFELLFMFALADLPVTSCSMARLEEILAPAAHEDTGVEIVAQLMLTRLLGRVSLPLPAS